MFNDINLSNALAEPPWHYRRRPNCSVGYALRCKGKEGA